MKENHITGADRAQNYARARAHFKQFSENLQPHGNGLKLDLEQRCLPKEGLPNFVQSYIEDVARCQRASTDAVALSCLVAASVVMQTNRTAQIRNFAVVPNLYGIVLGNASAGKSGSLTAPSKPIEAIDTDLHHKFVDEFEIYESAVYSKKKGDLKPTPPKHRQYIMDEHTPEAIIKRMCQNSDNYGVMINGTYLRCDDMSGYFKRLQAYKGMDETTFLNTAYEGKTFNFDRVTSGLTRIENIRLSMLGNLQRALVKKYLSPEMAENGFLQRIMFVIDEEYHEPTTETNNKDLGFQWAQLLETINRSEKKELQADAEALKVYDDFMCSCSQVAKDVFSSTGNEAQISLIGKLSYFSTKLALIAATINQHNSITADDMAFAVRCSKYFYFTNLSVLYEISTGEKQSTTDTPTIIYLMVERLKAKGAKVNLRDLSKSLGQKPNFAADNIYKYKKQHGIEDAKPKEATKKPEEAKETESKENYQPQEIKAIQAKERAPHTTPPPTRQAIAIRKDLDNLQELAEGEEETAGDVKKGAKYGTI